MNIFLPSTITEWDKLDLSIRKSTSLHICKGRFLQFVKSLENSLFTCHNPIRITRLRLGFSHLSYHNFKHGFLDAVDPLCSCSTAIENTVHYFLYCPNFSTAGSSHTEVFLEKGVLKICSKFTGEHPCLSAISTKLQSNFTEITLRHGCSPVNAAYFQKTFSQEHI